LSPNSKKAFRQRVAAREALAYSPEAMEGLDHLGPDEVAVELVELCSPRNRSRRRSGFVAER